LKNIDNLLIEYKTRKSEIKRRLDDFISVPESEYFYELVYCLFTPQTSAENAFKVVEQIKDLKYFDKPFSLKKYLHQKDGTYIRFHNQKEKYVIALRKNYSGILNLIKLDISTFEKREMLVQNVKGLSYKEATHFLRNTGKNGDLAILDRHILKNLLQYNVIKEMPKTISKKIYFDIEIKFQEFARNLGIGINELDLLFWSIETGIILK
jgi:N-glycosylase/DNA lyase